MKQLAFSSEIRERLDIVKINIINTYQIDLAYFVQGWASLLSTATFTLSYVLLITVIYHNVHVIASYTKNDLLFLMLVAQTSYYTMWMWGTTNIQNLIMDINKGNLDLILTKPLPTLYYLSVRRIGIVGLIRDGLPTLLLLALFINWQHIHVSFINFLIGIVVFICGQLAINTFQFVFLLPAFWQGEASDLFALSMEFMGVPTQIPFEGLYSWLKVIFMTIIPTAVPSVVCTSVLLGKSNPMLLLSLSLLVAFAAILLKNYLWSLAMRHYTSASS